MGDDAGYSASELARRLKPGKRADRPFQTPGDVFEFWFSDSATNPVTLARKHKIWFGGGAAIDRLIARRGLDLIAKLASGEAWLWANKGPAERLAAIIALDQFTRNVFRDTPAMFENDAQALELCKTGLALGEDKALSPLKRWFFYMPLEHSESLDDQERCVDLFEDLAEAADRGPCCQSSWELR